MFGSRASTFFAASSKPSSSKWSVMDHFHTMLPSQSTSYMQSSSSFLSETLGLCSVWWARMSVLPSSGLASMPGT